MIRPKVSTKREDAMARRCSRRLIPHTGRRSVCSYSLASTNDRPVPAPVQSIPAPPPIHPHAFPQLPTPSSKVRSAASATPVPHQTFCATLFTPCQHRFLSATTSTSPTPKARVPAQSLAVHCNPHCRLVDIPADGAAATRAGTATKNKDLHPNAVWRLSEVITNYRVGIL